LSIPLGFLSGTCPKASNEKNLSEDVSKPGHDLLLNIALFVCLCTIWLAIALKYRGTAWDFTMFYVVGHVPASEIYDQQVLHEYGKRLLPQGVHYIAPYLRPAVGILPLRTLRFFSYWTGYWLFAAVQLAACVTILSLCVRHLAVRPGVAAGLIFFYPAMMGVVTGQDILLVALVAVAGLVILRNHKDFTAGLVLGLTTYKYNLFLFVPLLLIARRRWRGLAGWVTSASALALVSVMLAPVDAYIRILKSYESYAIGFSAANMISVRGPLSSIGLPLYVIVAGLILFAMFYNMSRLPLEQAFYMSQFASLLAGYYVNWYDATLLLVPLAWLVAPAQRLPQTPGMRVGRLAAGILFLATPLWLFGGVLPTLFMAIVFTTLCLMQFQRDDGPRSSIERRLVCPSASASKS
jgi:Glycosyltransferase family 87